MIDIERLQADISSLKEQIKKEQGFSKVQLEHTLKEYLILFNKLKRKYGDKIK